MRNWHTTFVGVGMVLTGLGQLVTGLTSGDAMMGLDIIGPMILTGIGFILSGDAKNT